jgi:complement component 1 Q subcomponent-binding protein, mitochondrial
MNEEMDEDFDMEQDDALPDEDYQQPKRTINQSGVKGGAVDVVAEDSIAPSDRDEDVASALNFPVHLDITISKPGDQSLEIRAVANDGVIEIDSIQHLESSKPREGEEDLLPYGGPSFDNLDPELRELFTPYLEERGINNELAQILPSLIEVKEQNEYEAWLRGLRKFIET